MPIIVTGLRSTSNKHETASQMSSSSSDDSLSAETKETNNSNNGSGGEHNNSKSKARYLSNTSDISEIFDLRVYKVVTAPSEFDTLLNGKSLSAAPLIKPKKVLIGHQFYTDDHKFSKLKKFRPKATLRKRDIRQATENANGKINLILKRLYKLRRDARTEDLTHEVIQLF